jgi:phenylalanyl-tRNA synthetase beta subunit
MRPTLLGSLLDAAALNLARGARDLALFESGTSTAPRRAARRRAPRARHC